MNSNKFLFALFMLAAFGLGIHHQVICQSTWIKTIDLDLLDSPYNLIPGDAETFYLTHRYENGGGSPVIEHLTKVSYTGAEVWSLKFEHYPYHVFEGPAERLDNGDLIVCFDVEDSVASSYQVYRINSDGEILWATSFPALVHLEIDYALRFYKIIQVAPNDIRLFFRMNYYWEADPPSAKNGFISLDSLGQERHREYFETNGEYQWPYNIVQTQDSQFVKVSRPTVGQIDGLLLRFEQLDTSFAQNWSYEIGPQDGGGGGPLCSDANGNVYFTWNLDTTGNGSSAHQLPTIISLNRDGEFRWMTHFGEDRSIPIFYDIISTTDGRIIAAGQEGNSLLSGGNYRTGWIACSDTDGNKLWERRYVLEEADESGNNFYRLIESSDGGLILHGVLYLSGAGSDVYVLKTDRFGCLNEDCGLYNFISLTTGVKNSEESNNAFYLSLVNHTLNVISKGIIFNEQLSYKLSSVNGVVISTGKLFDGNTEIDISGLPPDMYFVSISGDQGGSIGVFKFFNPY